MEILVKGFLFLPALKNHRLAWSRWLLLLAFVAITWQLYNIQVGRGAVLAVQARQMNVEDVLLEEYARGQITDRSGIPLTGVYTANGVVVFPQLMDDPQQDTNTLARILNINPDLLTDKAIDGAYRLTTPLKTAQLHDLQEANLPGVFLLPVSHRYGTSPLAAHVTGHLGKIDSSEQLKQLRSDSGKHYDLGDWVGKTGLEYFYEAQLKGQQPKQLAYLALDARGRIIRGPGLTVETARSDPSRRNVITTIDYHVQQVVEDVMDAQVDSGAVVVMRAGSGEILAMASRPGFHPAPRYMEETIKSPAGDVFMDRNVSLFQPGSVFKVVLAAAALETGLIDNSTKFFCAGSAAEPIHCWYEQGHGEITFQEAFAQSCNPSFVQLGEMLGATKIINYAKALGLADQTITGYPVKQAAQQDLSLIGSEFNLSNSNIGQGPVLVTPVQLAAMINTIASGGIYFTPRLVTGLSDDRNHIMEYIEGPKPRRALQPDTARQLQELMRLTTTEGAGKKADLPVWGSAGKTGSAEVAGEEDTVNAWFAGYAPANNPRYVIVVLAEKGHSGGETAAPVFRAIAEKLLQP